MDPYVIIKIGKEKFRSATHNNAGKTPKWKDVFEFTRTTETSMEVEVHDKDLISDDLVGSTKFDISNLCDGPSKMFSGNIKIYYKSKEAGEVFMELEFKSDKLYEPPKVPEPHPINPPYYPTQNEPVPHPSQDPYPPHGSQPSTGAPSHPPPGPTTQPSYPPATGGHPPSAPGTYPPSRPGTQPSYPPGPSAQPSAPPGPSARPSAPVGQQYYPPGGQQYYPPGGQQYYPPGGQQYYPPQGQGYPPQRPGVPNQPYGPGYPSNPQAPAPAPAPGYPRGNPCNLFDYHIAAMPGRGYGR